MFSPQALAPRVQEVDAAIAERSVNEVLRDVLRREVASLAVMGEAMDESLADKGLLGRRGEPCRMIELRLRLTETLRRTLDRYEQIAPTSEVPDLSAASDTAEASWHSLVEAIDEWHLSTPDEPVTPAEFDPEAFLRAVVIAEDPATKRPDKVRAARMLTRRSARQPSTCTCISTLRARNVIELHEWINEVRQAGVESAAADRQLAAIVRSVARGEERLEPYGAYRRTTEAIHAVIRDGVEGGTAAPRDRRRNHDTREDDPAVSPFWETLLSRDPKVRAQDRLDAFAVLDEMEVLPRCTCSPKPGLELAELAADETRGFVIRMVAQDHYRAAMIIARYPATHLAVRDAIDGGILAGLTASEAPATPAVGGPNAA